MSSRGYRPLPLHEYFTNDASIFEDSDELTLGDRELYGLPFQFGNADHAVLVLSPDGARTDVAIGGTASWVIFAHAVKETDLFEGGSIGDAVGAYTVRYADGDSHTVDLRQRIEIGPTPRKWNGRALPLDWGQTPFLAYNDAEHELMDRSCGRFDEAGARFVDIEDPQSRVPYVLPYRFYLWALKNPRPDETITRLEMVAHGHSVLVGAITLSNLDEEPFTRSVARDVLVTIDGSMDERVNVTVDRGSATYVYRTVEDPLTGNPLPGGWGRSRPESWSSGYTKISASPSATVRIRRGDEELSRFGWAELLREGRLALGHGTTVSLASSDRSWVTVTVTDEAGNQLPCRIRFQTTEGIPLAPYGHHAHINSDGGTWNLDIGGDVRLGSHSYAFIDGVAEGWLPIGRVVVEASRGFEYEPLRQEVVISADQSRLDLMLTRRFDSRARGYVSGDTHVHFVSSQGAELEARAEDVGVTNLLLTQWGHLFTSTEEFVGRPQYSPDRQTVVFAGQENRTNMLGHINLLGLRAPIMPWCTGGSEEADLGGGLETTLSHWADECRAQGGTVVLAHFPVPYGETAALLATGRLDAVETIAYDDYNIGEYYRYLNAGYRIPLVAGTDKMTSEVPIGLMRTYAGASGPDVDYWAWCDGIKRGDTMASSGPLLWLSVDGERPGSVLTDIRRATVTVEFESIFPVDVIEIVQDGRVIHRESVQTNEHRVVVDVDLNGSSWVAARAFGAGNGVLRHTDTWSRPVFAHTSPVYLSSDKSYEKFDATVVTTMVAIVEGARRYVTERSRIGWSGITRHRHGEADHLAYLTRPFDEALTALHARLADNPTLSPREEHL